MTEDKFVVEVFSKEKLELRIKEIQDEIKRKEDKLAETIMNGIFKELINDTRTNDTRGND